MTTVIGITGGIASGKSTVSDRLKEYGIPVIDADIIAREVVEPGKKAYHNIVTTFGREIISDDDTIDRKKLGEIVFNDEAKRKKLNEIVHPEVRKEMLSQRDHFIKNGAKCVVLDIPLLYESNLTHYVDQVIVVYVDNHTQINRLMKRNNLTLEEAKSRISSQMPLDEKVKRADFVINNNGTKEETYRQLENFLNKNKLI